jgi:predicted DNA-binding protein
MATKHELLAAARAGEDIDERPETGEWASSTTPMVPSAHPDGTVLVGRSLRMSIGTYQRIKAAASARGTTWSALVREWIDQGLETAEAGASADPIAELHRSIDAATRALHALERPPAA